jgi:hypothetical protein
MKKLLICFAAVVAIALTSGLQSCKDKTVMLSKEITVDQFCIAPAQSKWITHDFTITQADWTSFLSQNGINVNVADLAGNVEQLRFESFQVNVVSPAGLNFNEYDYAELYLKRPSESGDGTKVAFVSSISNGGVTSIAFESQGDELKSLIAEPSLTGRIRIFRNDPSSAQHCFSGKLKMKIEVKKD